MGETAARELEWTASVGLRRRAGLGKGQEMSQTGLAETQEQGGGPGLDGILSRRGQ